MPIKRDHDGNIVEQPTELTNGGNKTNLSPTQKETSAGNNNQYDAKTVLVRSGSHNAQTSKNSAPTDVARDNRNTQQQTNKNQPNNQPSTGSGGEAATRVFRPNNRSQQIQPKSPPTAAVSQPSIAPQFNAMDDPPVGWLVVIAGPGQGNAVTLGNGVNAIGRDKSQRLSLDFGDELISRTDHASVTYDPRGKKFYIQHGGGTNLTYIGDEPILMPKELTNNTNVMLGNTTLRFVSLCGAQFDWDKLDDNK